VRAHTHTPPLHPLPFLVLLNSLLPAPVADATPNSPSLAHVAREDQAVSP